MQRLREVGFHLHLTRAGGGPGGPAERGEKIGARVAVGNLGGPRAQRQPLELVLGAGRRGHDVEQHLGPDPPQLRLREVLLVVRVGFVGTGRPLVGVRRADLADEFLEVILRLDQALRQSLKESLVRRRIAHPHVVDFVDDTPAEEVGPDDIRQVAAEVRVVGGGEPRGEHLAAILAGVRGALEVGSRTAEEGRGHDPPAHRVFHVAAAGVEDDRLPRVFSLLAADLGEEVGEAVVVVHRPAVEGMVVALGALDPHPHEDLGHVLRGLERVPFVLEVVGGGVGEGAPLRREEFADEDVDRRVGLDPVLEPTGVEEHRLVADLVLDGADHHQLRPLHHPLLDELLSLEQLVDEVGPLVGVGARHEGVVFVRRGEHTADVEAGPPKKLFVAARPRRVDPQRVQLGVDELVDMVRHRWGGPFEGEVLRQRDHLRAHRMGREAGHHEGLAAAAGGDEPRGVDLRRAIVVREKDRQRRHVAVGAVGILREHGELLRGVRPVEHGLAGVEFDGHDRGRRTRIILRASFEPLLQGGVVGVVGPESGAARVGHGGGRLGEQQTLGGEGEVDPPSTDLAGESVVVGLGVEAEEREPEAVFAAGRAVATAGVAAVSHEDRHHIAAETQVGGEAGMFDVHRHRACLVGEGDRERGVAVGKRLEHAAVEAGLGCIRDGERRLGGDVAGDPARFDRLHDERLAVAGIREVDGRRVDTQGGNGRGRFGRDDSRPHERHAHCRDVAHLHRTPHFAAAGFTILSSVLPPLIRACSPPTGVITSTNTLL